MSDRKFLAADGRGGKFEDFIYSEVSSLPVSGDTGIIYILPVGTSWIWSSGAWKQIGGGGTSSLTKNKIYIGDASNQPTEYYIKDLVDQATILSTDTTIIETDNTGGSPVYTKKKGTFANILAFIKANFTLAKNKIFIGGATGLIEEKYISDLTEIVGIPLDIDDTAVTDIKFLVEDNSADKVKKYITAKSVMLQSARTIYVTNLAEFLAAINTLNGAAGTYDGQTVYGYGGSESNFYGSRGGTIILTNLTNPLTSASIDFTASVYCNLNNIILVDSSGSSNINLQLNLGLSYQIIAYGRFIRIHDVTFFGITSSSYRTSPVLEWRGCNAADRDNSLMIRDSVFFECGIYGTAAGQMGAGVGHIYINTNYWGNRSVHPYILLDNCYSFDTGLGGSTTKVGLVSNGLGVQLNTGQSYNSGTLIYDRTTIEVINYGCRQRIALWEFASVVQGNYLDGQKIHIIGICKSTTRTFINDGSVVLGDNTCTNGTNPTPFDNRIGLFKDTIGAQPTKATLALTDTILIGDSESLIMTGELKKITGQNVKDLVLTGGVASSTINVALASGGTSASIVITNGIITSVTVTP